LYNAENIFYQLFSYENTAKVFSDMLLEMHFKNNSEDRNPILLMVSVKGSFGHCVVCFYFHVL